ncbi:sensor histidine kinase [Nitrosococcus watsonii]|uniref:histidine kinase n=1 Tax=Nitrosococcus watsoni (strain C-113) TaxID=105559 RepID=D8K8N3_NITWC|nr:HAMP domain-containing sensor histidine kinase [Nitrosococcus watsonii]ADJ29153.1 integral membrane sensor signal transduction histidine kinase [Nitrosococcus watsonii C-113]
MRAKTYRPGRFYWVRLNSFITLILGGFLIVAVPLSAGLIFAAVQMEHLARQSTVAVYKSVQVTQGSRILVQQLIAMERAARQFQVLDDPALYRAYMANRRKFKDILEQMLELPLSEVQRQGFDSLAREENAIYDVLSVYTLNSEASKQAANQFLGLARQARTLLAESNQLVGKEVDTLQETAREAQKSLFWQALGLIPAAGLLAVLFTFLIRRYFHQLDKAIRRLGNGDFDTPIEVTGPRDLEVLGQQLDWLRCRLVELEETKIKFLRHVSHELKTPLAALREGSELLCDQIIGHLSAQQLEVARILRSNSLRLQKLIEDMLRFNLAGTNQIERTPEVVRLDQLIKIVLNDHIPSSLSKQVELIAALNPVEIFGDREHLKIIIDNLLSNALKYSPSGSSVEIKLTQEEDEVCLEVHDSGSGVAPEDSVRIFDSFYQGKTQPSGPVKGTGLGLSIVKEIVLAHGGNIELVKESREGAHFRVTLPVVAEEWRS